MVFNSLTFLVFFTVAVLGILIAYWYMRNHTISSFDELFAFVGREFIPAKSGVVRLQR